MTDSILSPAAIAVDDALAACIQLQGEIVRARPLAAAALRAAAEQLRNAYANEDYVDSADDLLDAIAAELEGATR